MTVDPLCVDEEDQDKETDETSTSDELTQEQQQLQDMIKQTLDEHMKKLKVYTVIFFLLLSLSRNVLYWRVV